MAIGPLQVVIILVIVLLLFGGRRLGEIGKGLGEGIKNFKKGVSDEDAAAAAKKPEVEVLSEKPSSSEPEKS
jgi:sec-independent protein translocase protein TatA